MPAPVSYTHLDVYKRQAHNPVIDKDGNVWGTYGILRAFSYRTGPDSLRLFRYSPDTDEMTFFDHGLPPVSYTHLPILFSCTATPRSS